MSFNSSIRKCFRFVLKKLDVWESSGKFGVDFDYLRSVVRGDFSDLWKEGLNFNINSPFNKELLCCDLERMIRALDDGESVNHFKTLFLLNSMNNENEELLELKEHKNMLNCEIYRSILESMYNHQCRGRPHHDVTLMFKIMYLQAKYN
ncbi:hypothetical protein, partial [Methanobrevibacter filiformis]|uniref:hypothetical protein n=1 Tax=Methanobrevibacter filiformis TaxID=55758 RepID=UPI000AD2399D